MISDILDIKPLLIIYLIEYLFATIIFLAFAEIPHRLTSMRFMRVVGPWHRSCFAGLRGSSIGVIIYKISVLT